MTYYEFMKDLTISLWLLLGGLKFIDASNSSGAVNAVSIVWRLAYELNNAPIIALTL